MAHILSRSIVNTLYGGCRHGHRPSTVVLQAIIKPIEGISGKAGLATTSDPPASGPKSINPDEIKKSVFISQSHDVFTNLALEDWIYRNYNFDRHHVLMLWINDPCVVIGRHQNPFAEANIAAMRRHGVSVLARRNSGGGTVYHDGGNLNCTFFTPRPRYNRKYNLQLITRALFREWTIKADILERDDIVIGGKKISGTAAKLGQPNAYHHCTLLVNSNKANLRAALGKEEEVEDPERKQDATEIISRATKSVPSPIKNLVDVNRHVNMSQLLSAIGYEFLRTPAMEMVDGGRELVMKQRGFQLINPTEKWFPGITALRDNFESWDWRFGKTPAFSVERKIPLKGAADVGGGCGGASNDVTTGGGGSRKTPGEVRLRVDIEHGVIQKIGLLFAEHGGEIMPVVSDLLGHAYTEDNLNAICESLQKGISAESAAKAINGM